MLLSLNNGVVFEVLPKRKDAPNITRIQAFRGDREIAATGSNLAVRMFNTVDRDGHIVGQPGQNQFRLMGGNVEFPRDILTAGGELCANQTPGPGSTRHQARGAAFSD